MACSAIIKGLVTFTQPGFLILLLLIPLSIWIALPRLFVRRRTTAGNKRPAATINRRMLASVFVRLALIGSVVFALAGLQAVRFTDKLAVVFLIDASDSVGQNGRERAAEWVRNALAAMRPGDLDQAGVVVFGSDAQIERSMSIARDLTPLGAQVRSAGTNVEGAIRLGLSMLPSDAARRLVLLSDGRQTVGDADAAARLVRAANARLDTVALPAVDGPDAAVERIDAPQRASVGQIIPLQIVVRSNSAQRAQLTVFAGPDVVAQQNVNLVVGQNEFSVRANASRAGFSAFRVQVAPEADVRPQNNALASSVIVGGPPRVLMVRASASQVDETGAIKAALAAAGVTVDEASARAMPSEIQSLASYQSVVLVNVPARELSQRTMLSLQSYVRDIGGGLVVIGGPNSYGVGGYFKTPLEETLPVDMQVKDPRRFPSVSIVIVMDKSGSMSTTEGGVLKMRLAAEAAARVAELVNDDDEVTVIGFDTEPVDIIGPFAGRDRAKFLPKILAIAPGGGGIYVYDSLIEAQRIVEKSTKLTRFVILLADGSDSEKQDGVRDLVRRMNQQSNTTLTVVAIGDGSDVPFLKNVASAGRGRFHLTDKAATLPTIFTEEAALAQRSYIVEQAFFPKQNSASPILSGITAVPQLLGYIASTPKPSAQVVLRANDSDPLLATWQYGLGRAVAFTSDATGRWGKQWVQWQDFPKFWAQTIRWTILERSPGALQASIAPRGDGTVISAELPEGRDDASLRLNATVLDASGASSEVSLVQVAPGRYEAETYLEQAGAYFVRIRPVISGSAEISSTETLQETAIAYVKPYSPEYGQASGGDESLRNWSELAGGALLTDPRQAFELSAPVAAARTDLFPLLLALAAILLPFDVGVRRTSVGLRKLFGRVAELASGPLGSSGPAAATGGKSAGAPASQPIRVVPRAAPATNPGASAAAQAGQSIRVSGAADVAPQKKGAQPAASAPGATAGELLKRKQRKRQSDSDAE